MIWDSVVWKEELAKDLQHIRRSIAAVQPDASYERTAVAIEKFAFTSAFIVRKLLEANKLSDEIESASISVTEFPRIDIETPIHFLNWHRFQAFYDLDTGARTNLSPRRLCNTLIHSFVFVPETDEAGNRFDSILFNSDHSKDKQLYRIALDTLFTFIEAVASDDIAHLVIKKAPGTDAIFVRKSRDLPELNANEPSGTA